MVPDRAKRPDTGDLDVVPLPLILVSSFLYLSKNAFRTECMKSITAAFVVLSMITGSASARMAANNVAGQHEAFKACGIEDAKPLNSSGMAVIDPVTATAASAIKNKCAEGKQ